MIPLKGFILLLHSFNQYETDKIILKKFYTFFSKVCFAIKTQFRNFNFRSAKRTTINLTKPPPLRNLNSTQNRIKTRVKINLIIRKITKTNPSIRKIPRTNPRAYKMAKTVPNTRKTFRITHKRHKVILKKRSIRKKQTVPLKKLQIWTKVTKRRPNRKANQKNAATRRKRLRDV